MTWLNNILIGDVREVFKQIPDKSVHTIVTSPPYWQMRYYDSPAVIWDSETECKHLWKNLAGKISSDPEAKGFRKDFEYLICTKCNCGYGELGLEPTPELYISHMLEICDTLWRILRDDGTFWLNMGDCYAGSGQEQGHKPGDWNLNRRSGDSNFQVRTARPVVSGLKRKDLVGMPWMLALALRDAGWYLRRDVIWYKRNAAPESPKDRPITAHEYLFLLTKRPFYFYDNEAIKEKDHPDGRKKTIRKKTDRYTGKDENLFQDNQHERWTGKRNKRSVWDIPTKGFKGAHFATFPPELIIPCIMAGTSQLGCCPVCGKQWERVVIPTESYRQYLGQSFLGDRSKIKDRKIGKSQSKISNTAYHLDSDYRTLGWVLKCGCYGYKPLPFSGYWDGDDFIEYKNKCGRYLKKPERCPSIVCDPFMGSGTTAEVAIHAGRHYTGAEINPEYTKIQKKRLEKFKEQMSLL